MRAQYRTPALVGRLFLIAISQLALLPAQHAMAEETQSRVKLRMVLVLRDLTLRPVPRHTLQIVTAFDSSPSQKALSITTGFDGTAEVTLGVGSYHVVVQDPAELEDKQYTWDISFSVLAGQKEVTVDLSNDNATVQGIQSKAPPLTAEGRVFSETKNAVVTVESETGHGSGFLVDAAGLILTNAHVVEGSRELAIDFDGSHRFIAEKLAVDSENDIAVLRCNPVACSQAQPLKLSLSPQNQSLREGDAVIAIGSPLNQEKILTRGIISKVQDRVIISDVNINHGNSGGPLLDSTGQVVGITTFKDLDPTGGGVAGIVRIFLAEELLAKARAAASVKDPPDSRPLPSMPADTFPLGELKKLIQGKPYNPRDYGVRSATFDVQLITPPLKYYLETKEAAEAADLRAKKLKKAGTPSQDPDADPYANLKAWRVSLGAYRPVIEFCMLPRLKATGGSIFGAIMTGVPSALHYRYKSDFDSGELVIDGKAITPIRRSRITQTAKFISNAGSANDVSFAGVYTFGPEFLDQVRPSSHVVLVIHDGMKPEKPILIQLGPELLFRIRDDMAPVTRPTPIPEEASLPKQ